MKDKHHRSGALSGRERGGLWLGKIGHTFSRLAGRGGSTLPGRLAGNIAPGLLQALAGQVPCNLILTGSNGKTTTAFLLAALLRRAGMRPIHNQSGANLTGGITGTFIDEASWRGRLGAGAAVIEADEAYFSGIVRALRPRGVLVTNICRDQLDRYGDEDTVRAMIGDGLVHLPAAARVLLNADDPAVAGLGALLGGADRPPASRAQLLFYGLEPGRRVVRAGRDPTRVEFKTCPRCGGRLAYSTVYFAHLGQYYCTACSFRRPRPHYRLLCYTRTTEKNTAVTIATPGMHLHFRFSLPGLFNLYNALAATACAHAFGVAGATIESGLAAATPPFGRMERFALDGRPVTLVLIKNAAGGNAVLQTILETPGRFALGVVINDHCADGTDISWLWDVDFEKLVPALRRISTLVVSGRRAPEAALRLKYAGIEPSRLVQKRKPIRALERCLQEPSGVPLYLLLTYTAMLELRRITRHRGVVRPYWEMH